MADHDEQKLERDGQGPLRSVNDPPTGFRDDEDKMPKGLLAAVIAAVLLLAGLMAYNHWVAPRLAEEQAKGPATPQVPEEQRLVPETFALQGELTKLVSVATEGSEKEEWVKSLALKYKSNTRVEFFDNIKGVRQSLEFHEYLKYLKVFTQPGTSIRITSLQVIGIESRGDSTLVLVQENFIAQ